MLGSGEGVSSDTDAEGLTESYFGGLVDGFVGEGTRSRNDPDGSGGEDVSRHDADLAAAVEGGGDDSGTVGTDETRFRLTTEDLGDADLVLLGDTFGDADDEGDLGFDGLDDGVGGKGRGNVDDRCVRIRFSHRLSRAEGEGGVLGSVEGTLTDLLDGSEDGLTEMD